jgi:hypothetical protein
LVKKFSDLCELCVSVVDTFSQQAQNNHFHNLIAG